MCKDSRLYLAVVRNNTETFEGDVRRLYILCKLYTRAMYTCNVHVQCTRAMYTCRVHKIDTAAANLLVYNHFIYQTAIRHNRNSVSCTTPIKLVIEYKLISYI